MKKRKGKAKYQNQLEYIYNLFVRYLVALFLPINSLAIFYFVFTPLTLYLSYWLIKLFYPITMQGNLLGNGHTIQIINACIAGSAYYLLALLNLTTKGISWLTRIKAFIFGSISLLILNILRIVILALVLFAFGIKTFNQIHIGFWIIGSTLFVVFIWLATIKFFRIKEIPVYSDIKEVLKLFKK